MTQTVTTPGSGLVFVNTYSQGDSAQYINCIVQAEQALESQWATPLTVNVTFATANLGYSSTGTYTGASNSFNSTSVSYASLTSALASHEFSQYAIDAVNSLPSTSPNPNGFGGFSLPEAYARMLGLNNSTPSTDMTVTLNNNSNIGWTYGQDVINTLEHELSEGALGRVGGLGDQNGVWSTMDLFRYNSAGAPDYADGRYGQTTYFSYDGGAVLSSGVGLSFNNEKGTPPNNGDTADFTQQDVFGAGNPGETDTLSQTDLEMMDVLGWDPTAEDFWTGGSGSWTSDFVTPWSTGSAPIASQDAWINELNPNLTLSVVASKGNVTVNSIQITNHSSLEIENDSTFAATNGTQLNSDDGGLTAPGNTGSIFVDDGSTLQAGGTFDNPGGIFLQSTGDATNFEVEADGVTLTGGGYLDMSPNAQNTITSAPNLLATPTLKNLNNNIQGGGVMTALNFVNYGFMATSFGNSGPGTFYIYVGSGYSGGSFQNIGTLFADDGGTFVIGENGYTTTITNAGTIKLDGLTATTSLVIAGTVTIQQFFGTIALAGSGAATNDQIVDNGRAATLNLDSGELTGAGVVGDANMTLNIVDATIDADVSHAQLALNTGSNAISNQGTLEADGGTLLIRSTVNNSGAGTVEIGAGGDLDLFAGAQINGDVQFAGANATLTLNSSSAPISGIITGAGGTDAIDFAATPYNALNSAVWSQNAFPLNEGPFGTLSIVNVLHSTVASISLNGSYDASQFSESSDGNGGTLVTLSNPFIPVVFPGGGIGSVIIMFDAVTGVPEMYDVGNNGILAAYALGQVGLEWQIAGVGGFSGAGTSDMLMRDSNNGTFEIYDIANNNIASAAGIGQVGTEWAVAGFGGFSSNPNETDMLMRDAQTGQFEVYDIRNNQIANATGMGQVGSEWTVAGFGDFSSNPNETDMLMRNSNTGTFEIYDISNNSITFAASMGQVGLEWTIAGFGDFSGNPNETDMLLRNSNTGSFEIYDISNNKITFAASMGQVGLEWQVAAFGDFSGNAHETDMLLRNSNTGMFEVYDISNNTITSAGSMGQVGLDWQVGGVVTVSSGGTSGAATTQLTQAMASMVTSAPVSAGNTGQVGAETSPQTLVTIPQPG